MLLLVLLVGVTAVGVGRLFDLRADFEDASSATYQLELAGERMRSAFILQQAAVRGARGGGATDAEAFREASATAGSITERARELAAVDPDAAAAVERRTAAAERWRSEVAEPVLAGRDPDRELAAELAGAVLDADRQLIERQRERREALRESVSGDTRTTLVWILVGLGCALAAGLLAVAGIAESMRQPVTRLAEAARRLAGGDLDARVEAGGPVETSQLGEAFNEMAGELQASEQLKDEFLSTVSHELRSPLTSMQGFAELLLLEPDGLTPEQVDHVEVILNSTKQLATIVNDLLDLARSDAGRLRVDLEPCEVEPLVRGAARMLNYRIAAKGQRLEVDVEYGLPPLLADPGRVGQVLGNLLTNAHLYTPEGGALRLAARRAPGDRVELSVSDTGPGLDPEQFKHIFDRFWRADASDSRRIGGTGLGLAIAKLLVELHGGEIAVSSPPGEGATFRVLLPTAARRASAGKEG